MGIDFGDARIGVAFSDPTQTLAGEAYTITEYHFDQAVETLCSLIRESSVSEVVLGNPKNMNGTQGPRAEKSRALAQALQDRCGVPVILWDERRTTVDAHRILTENGARGKKRKKRVDAVAATLILQGYLDYKKNP